MRYCKKISVALLLFGATTLALAGSDIQIKSAELQAHDEFYSLDGDIEMRFDKDIEEAVNKGVPLNFVLEFQIVSPRKYWFDDEVVTATQNVTLSYYALTRQYLVSRGKQQESYESLADAMRDVVGLNNWKVIERSQLEKGEVYKAALLIRLDQNKLPTAIQVEAIGSEKWNLTSEKYEWILKEQHQKELPHKEPSSKEAKP